MIEVTHRTVEANGIRMHLAEAGDGPLVVLCHGFPECWYSWRHQLRALAKAGFHAVAPDMRGYGQTDAPAEVVVRHFLQASAALFQPLHGFRLDSAVNRRRVRSAIILSRCWWSLPSPGVLPAGAGSLPGRWSPPEGATAKLSTRPRVFNMCL
jgi:hypothetical protein